MALARVLLGAEPVAWRGVGSEVAAGNCSGASLALAISLDCRADRSSGLSGCLV